MAIILLPSIFGTLSTVRSQWLIALVGFPMLKQFLNAHPRSEFSRLSHPRKQRTTNKSCYHDQKTNLIFRDGGVEFFRKTPSVLAKSVHLKHTPSLNTCICFSEIAKACLHTSSDVVGDGTQGMDLLHPPRTHTPCYFLSIGFPGSPWLASLRAFISFCMSLLRATWSECASFCDDTSLVEFHFIVLLTSRSTTHCPHHLSPGSTAMHHIDEAQTRYSFALGTKNFVAAAVFFLVYSFLSASSQTFLWFLKSSSPEHLDV